MICDDIYMSRCPPYGGGGGDRFYPSSSTTMPLINSDSLSTHNNFLTLPGTIISNQKGN